jgi:hypothetical protein
MTDPCIEKREESEPMFVLLARDTAAPYVVEYWANFRQHQINIGERPDTPEERQHIAEVREKVKEFRAWRAVNRRPL